MKFGFGKQNGRLRFWSYRRGKSTAAAANSESGNQLVEIPAFGASKKTTRKLFSWGIEFQLSERIKPILLWRIQVVMTQCGRAQWALSASTASLQKAALLIACLFLSDCRSGNAGDTADAGLLTEEYTVWPKNFAAPFANGYAYPWKSCNRTTGADCPGLSDYIHHFCVDYGNAGCPRKNRILAGKRVILHLLPGEHKIPFRRCFSWFVKEAKPHCHLFCNVSVLSIRGKHVSETTILAVRRNKPARLKSDEEGDRPHARPCNWDCDDRSAFTVAEWSAFAFRGGGNVTFQDITFRSRSISPEPDGQNFILAWDLRRFKVQRCHFELRKWRGALALLTSKYVQDMPQLVEMIVNECTFGLGIGSSWHSPVSSVGSVRPAIAVMPMELCGQSKSIVLIGTHGKPSVKLYQCRFQMYFDEDAHCRKR